MNLPDLKTSSGIPFCIFLSEKINKKTFVAFSIVICSIFLLDEVYNLVIARVIHTPRASDVYKSIGFKYMDFKE